jgi:hypothetical protein
VDCKGWPVRSQKVGRTNILRRLSREMSLAKDVVAELWTRYGLMDGTIAVSREDLEMALSEFLKGAYPQRVCMACAKAGKSSCPAFDPEEECLLNDTNAPKCPCNGCVMVQAENGWWCPHMEDKNAVDIPRHQAWQRANKLPDFLCRYPSST